MLLTLAKLDAASGRIERELPLASFYDCWQGKLPCQATRIDDQIVATVGGSVLCCDLEGTVRWIRRQFWIATPENSYDAVGAWFRQRHVPPLVRDGRVYATQPGVFHLECLDLATGGLVWRKAVPGLVSRLTCVAGQTVVVETRAGLAALDCQSGQTRWRYETEELLDARLVGPGNGILLTRREPTEKENAPARPILEWIDSQTGQMTAETTLDTAPQKDLEMGPLIVHGGRQWVFFRSSDKPADRDILELVRRQP
jgi:outer membrane protein assembly factor BamB